MRKIAILIKKSLQPKTAEMQLTAIKLDTGVTGALVNIPSKEQQTKKLDK